MEILSEGPEGFYESFSPGLLYATSYIDAAF